MTDMGDDFRAMRDHQRKVKSDRLAKFNQAFGFIQKDAATIGVSVSRDGPDDSWFFRSEDEDIQWWPQSGKTADGDYFSGWPELKAYFVENA